MGAEIFRQLRSDAVYEPDRRSLTCAETCEQALRTPARPVRDEVVCGPDGIVISPGMAARNLGQFSKRSIPGAG
jgi:hypothetical protein